MEMSSTVNSALEILTLLRDRGPLRTGELVDVTASSRTSVNRLLVTLEARGFVRRTDDGFVIGAIMASFADAAAPALLAAARPHLVELSEQTEETALLALRDGQYFVITDQIVARHRLTRIEYSSGPSQLLTVAAHGRAMLAHVATDEYESMSNNHPDPSWLDEEMREVRSRGLATSSGELEDGVVGAASAILEEGAKPVASIGLIAPAGRADFEQWSETIPAAAGAISVAIRADHMTTRPGARR